MVRPSAKSGVLQKSQSMPGADANAMATAPQIERRSAEMVIASGWIFSAISTASAGLNAA
jgi:hypothetical protein